MDYRVTHVIPDSNDPGHRIDAIYGPFCGLVYQDEAIRRIDTGFDSFHTYVGGNWARVYVARRGLTRFLTTSADGYGPNNLCQLPRHWG